MGRAAQLARKRRFGWAAVGMASALAVASVVAMTAPSHSRAAVGQVNTAFACIMPSGGPARVWAFAPTCTGGQVISWSVQGVAGATTTTAKPTTTATSPATQPPTTPPTVAPTLPAGNEIRLPGTYTTAYDYQDNNPPNSATISHPVIHQTAGGTGTYADPLTVAVDHLGSGGDQFAPGTRFYVPNVRAYLIAEDTTGETAPGTVHLDMWAGGQTSSTSSAFDCMSHVTGHVLVIENPASNYAVVAGPLAADNACRQLFGDAVVTSGGPGPTTTIGGSSACPTAKPASTYQGPTLTVAQTLQYAYNAGFRSVGQLQAVVGIGRAESSLVTQTRNWHPEYGCRPASDMIGVQGPASAWNGNHTQQINSDRGVWQISSHFWPAYSDAQTDDPAQAAGIVWTLSNHGASFSPWDTWNSGAAQALVPSAATVNAFLATQ